MTPNTIDRRRFLHIAGVTAIGASLAGCTEENGNGNGAENDEPEPENSDESEDGADGEEDEYEYIDNEPDYESWFDNVGNYEGTVDWTGEDEVEVVVGAGDQGLLFEPPAIAVDPGTTVVWEWTGDGGAHDVVDENGAFESELVDEAGHTFEHTFEEEGVYQYICTPHEANGKKGAVLVEE